MRPDIDVSVEGCKFVELKLDTQVYIGDTEVFQLKDVSL